MLYCDHQIFTGDYNHESKLLAFGGKVAHREIIKLKGKNAPKQWIGAIFPFKVNDNMVDEISPFIIHNENEPLYQLRFYKQRLLGCSRTKRFYIFGWNSQEFYIKSVFTLMNNDRKLESNTQQSCLWESLKISCTFHRRMDQ